LWIKCATSAECKTDISAVLTVEERLRPSHELIKWNLCFIQLFNAFRLISILSYLIFFHECGQYSLMFSK
jgi:hypothetical protein